MKVSIRDNPSNVGRKTFDPPAVVSKRLRVSYILQYIGRAVCPAPSGFFFSASLERVVRAIAHSL
jgi:hypothetical protein